MCFWSGAKYDLGQSQCLSLSHSLSLSSTLFSTNWLPSGTEQKQKERKDGRPQLHLECYAQIAKVDMKRERGMEASCETWDEEDPREDLHEHESLFG